MILVDGTAEVTQGGRHVATLGRGDLVGEMALLQPQGSGRRNATVTAVTDAEIYAGSASEFRRIMEAAPSVAKVHQTIASRSLAAAADHPRGPPPGGRGLGRPRGSAPHPRAVQLPEAETATGSSTAAAIRTCT